MRSTPGSVQSIDRVLEILETLSTAPLGMSLSDLAAHNGDDLLLQNLRNDLFAHNAPHFS